MLTRSTVKEEGAQYGTLREHEKHHRYSKSKRRATGPAFFELPMEGKRSLKRMRNCSKWHDLSPEVLSEIVAQTGTVADVCAMEQVCRTWKAAMAAYEKTIWMALALEHFPRAVPILRALPQPAGFSFKNFY